MAHEVQKMFSVREEPWHKLGVVLEDYPGREEAMKLAGHDFNIEECPVYLGTGKKKKIEGWKALKRSNNGQVFLVCSEKYQVIHNATLWDIADEMMGQENVKYETAGTLKEGAVLWVLTKIDEPVKIKGDDSEIYPYCMVSTSHDYSRSCSALSTSVRVVCWNTYNLAVNQSNQSGLLYTFRHSGNVMERIEEAKNTLALTRTRHSEFIELANELARHKVTENGVKDFLSDFIPDPPANVSTPRVMTNIANGRAKIMEMLDSKSVAENHKRTAYGLFCAGIEYLDHARKARSPESYFQRTVYNANTLKPKVAKLALKVAK